MPRPREELPDVDQNSFISAELRQFRRQWSPANPAMGDAKWNMALELANRIDRALDELRKYDDDYIVEDAKIAARAEFTLALRYPMPRTAKDDLKMYVEMYAPQDQEADL